VGQAEAAGGALRPGRDYYLWKVFHEEGSQTPRMTKDDVELLYEYDRWANNRVLQTCSTLTSEHFRRDLGGSFSSIRDTLVHIFAGEWGRLQYWKEPAPDTTFMANMMARRKVLFDPNAFPDLASVRRKWAEVETEQIEFIQFLTDERLERMLPVRGTQVKLIHLLQHVANHSTYHRGQISLMMRQLDAVPEATDFHVFVMEGRAEILVG
jgi:uncharacterized damage-inducible protein DinB